MHAIIKTMCPTAPGYHITTMALWQVMHLSIHDLPLHIAGANVYIYIYNKYSSNLPDDQKIMKLIVVNVIVIIFSLKPIYIYIYICIYIYTYIYICVCVYLCICIYIYLLICTYIYG